MLANSGPVVEASLPIYALERPLAFRLQNHADTAVAGAAALCEVWNQFEKQIIPAGQSSQVAFTAVFRESELLQAIKNSLKSIDRTGELAQPAPDTVILENRQPTLPPPISALAREALKAKRGFAIFQENKKTDSLQAFSRLSELEHLAFVVGDRAEPIKSPGIRELTQDMLMLIRALSWTLHENFDRKLSNASEAPIFKLRQERRNFSSLVTEAVSGTYQMEAQTILYGLAASSFQKCVALFRGAKSDKLQPLVDAGFRLGFVGHILAGTSFCYTTPGFLAIRGELYRSLEHLDKFLRPSETGDYPERSAD